jgi:hypothetical protein
MEGRGITGEGAREEGMEGEPIQEGDVEGDGGGGFGEVVAVQTGEGAREEEGEVGQQVGTGGEEEGGNEGGQGLEGRRRLMRGGEGGWVQGQGEEGQGVLRDEGGAEVGEGLQHGLPPRDHGGPAMEEAVVGQG